MRCKDCGLELDASNQLPNGAYQCPECGAINHTASSSKASPSPWRRKRHSNFAPGGSALTRRYIGLPLWGWLAAALALVLVIVLLVIFLVRGAAPDKVAEDNAYGSQSAVVDQPIDSLASPGADVLTVESAPVAGPTSSPAAAAAKHTGVAAGDFTVGFDWAMNYLHYSAALTAGTSEVGPAGEAIQNYSFEGWCDVQLASEPASNMVSSASVTARLAEGATDETPVLAAFVSALYGFDKTTNAGTARTEVEAMIADNTLVYEANSFTATLTSGAAGYTLRIQGKLE